MKVSDYLLRHAVSLSMLSMKKHELLNLQENDEVLKDVIKFVATNRWPTNCNEETKAYKSHRENLIFGLSGENFYQCNNEILTIPPTSIKKEILKAHHDQNGHPGENQTVS